MANPQSTARIAGHPIHPMLIPFPIAFFVGTFACDVAYWITGNANWATVTPWLLGAGIIMGALAALAGLTDVIGEQRIRALNDVWLHAGGMVIVILIEIYNWYSRYTEGGNRKIMSSVSCCSALDLLWEIFSRYSGRRLSRHNPSSKRNSSNPGPSTLADNPRRST